MNAVIPTLLLPSLLLVFSGSWSFIRKVLNATFLMLLLNTFAAAAPRPSIIQDIRTISSADATRVVISLSGPIAYELRAEPSILTSASSARLYVRFSPASLAPGVRSITKVDDGILKEVRAGLIEDSVIRVSLEVEQLGTYRATAFRSPDQIVIQLYKHRESRVSIPPLTRPLLPASSPKVPVDRQVAVTQPLPTPPSPFTDRQPTPPLPRPSVSLPKGPVEREEKISPPLLPPLPPLENQQQDSSSLSPSPLLSKTPLDRQVAITPPLPPPASAPAQVEEPTPSPSMPRLRYRIMLDPGHGGSDPGAQGINGLQEKAVVLAVSKRLAQKLRTRLGADVILTRTDDVFIPLPERTARANAAKADLFVSIHANASPNPETHGIETYYLNNTEDRATIRLAKLENGIRAKQQLPQREDSLSYILSDLIQTGKEEESIALARAIQVALVNQVRTTVPLANDLGVKRGPFYVLVGAHMPCVLVELAFLTHADEVRRLGSASYQETLAEGLFHGIADFLRADLSAKNL